MGGRLIASYAVVPPVLLLPHALCLLQTALDSLLSLLPLPPCSWFSVLVSEVCGSFGAPALTVLHFYLSSPEMLFPVICALPTQSPSPASPTPSSCLLREEWGDSSGLKHPCEEGWYHLVGGTSHLPVFQVWASCSYHKSNGRAATAQVIFPGPELKSRWFPVTLS